MEHPRRVYQLLNETAQNTEQRDMAALAMKFLSLAASDLDIATSVHVAKCDVFLVLGKVLNRDASPKPELVARLDTALRASQINPEASILVSGGGVGCVKEAEVMKQWLTARGVSNKRIWGEPNSKDTVENITMSTAMLTQRDVKNICIISGGRHIVRASHLLSTHIARIDANIKISHLTPAAELADQASRESLSMERFLLFKDLGRILGIWDYRNGPLQP